MAGNRPEASRSGFVSVPVISICRSDEDTLPRMVLCMASIGLPEAVAGTGHDLLDASYFSSRESIHLRDFNEEFPLKHFKEAFTSSAFMLFREPLAADDSKCRR